MLLDRETRLTRRCSPLWRLIYPTACLAAVLLVAGTLGVRPAEAQSEEVPPPPEPVAESSPAVEEIPAEVPTPVEPADAESPATEEVLQELPSVEPADAESPAADTSKPPVKAKPRRQIALQAERDDLRLQLKALQASVRSLSQMVESLRARQTFGQAGGAAFEAGAAIPIPQVKPGQSQVAPRVARAVPEGHRVVAVKVNRGTDGEFLPGDRVDVLLDRNLTTGSKRAVVPNVKVFALGPDSPYAERIVLLALAPTQAQQLVEAGKVSLQHRRKSARSLSLPTLPPEPSAPKPEPRPEPPLPTFPSETPRVPKTTPAGRRTDPFGAVADRRAPQGTRLDLVRLATSYADVVGELEIAKLELEGRKELADRNVVPKQELAIAEVKLKTAQRKLNLLSDIAKSALMATEAEMAAAERRLDWLKTSGPNDHPDVETSKSELIRAQSRLDILRSILGSAGR